MMASLAFGLKLTLVMIIATASDCLPRLFIQVTDPNVIQPDDLAAVRDTGDFNSPRSHVFDESVIDEERGAEQGPLGVWGRDEWTNDRNENYEYNLLPGNRWGRKEIIPAGRWGRQIRSIEDAPPSGVWGRAVALAFRSPATGLWGKDAANIKNGHSAPSGRWGRDEYGLLDLENLWGVNQEPEVEKREESLNWSAEEEEEEEEPGRWGRTESKPAGRWGRAESKPAGRWGRELKLTANKERKDQ